MIAYLFAASVGLGTLAIIQFRRREIYSGAVLGQASMIVGWWMFFIVFENQITPAKVPHSVPLPVPQDMLWTMLTVVLVSAVSFFVGQRLSSTLLRAQLGPKRLVYFPPFERQTVGVSNKKLFDVCFVAAVVLALLTGEGWWIFAPYPENKGIWAVVTFIPQSSLITGLLALVAFHAGLLMGGNRKLLGLLLILALTGHWLMAGQRANMVVVIMGAFALFFYQAPPSRRRWLLALAVAMIYPLITLMSNISKWRHYLRYETFELTFQTSFVEWLVSIPNIGKSMPDMYYAVIIFSKYGGYFEGRLIEFMFIFIRQIIPGRILEALGLGLYNGPWALAGFRPHGGGFYPPAEMFFLHGYLGVVVLSAYFGMLAAVLDRIWRTSIRVGLRNMVGNPVLLLTVIATITMPLTLYGLQTWHRLATLPIIFLVFFELWRQLRIGRSGHRRVARFGNVR